MTDEFTKSAKYFHCWQPNLGLPRLDIETKISSVTRKVLMARVCCQLSNQSLEFDALALQLCRLPV